MFRHINQLAICVVLSLSAPLHAGDALQQLKDSSINRTKEQIAEIDTELQSLSNYSLRSGIGAIGYRSQSYPTSDIRQWVEIELNSEAIIDEIVMVPTIWRDTNKGFLSDGFPEAFRIVVGTESNRTGTVVAEYTNTAAILPRLAPLVIPISETAASWIRIEANKLSLRIFDGRYVFQLSELMAFSGTENMALRCPVKASSNARETSEAWDKSCLVDGFTPYLMDSAQGSQSKAYVSQGGDKPTLLLDLKQEYPLSRIHLHAVDQSDTVPQAYAGDLGIPHHLLVEGATQSDFSDAVTLLEFKKKSINETGPLMMWRIPETTCRFVRFSEAKASSRLEFRSSSFRIGFAEIELFSGGMNVALGKPASESETLVKSNRSPDALTDGNNLYGRILPVRHWMEELARRHELERQRPIIEAELSSRYARQKINLNRVTWLAVLLAVGIGFTILIDRLVRNHKISIIRERFAADLHDELSANIHTIGLLSDLAKDAIDSPEELTELLDRTRVFTERSGAAVRYCTNMLEAKTLCHDLVEEMRRSSKLLLADLEHEISFEGEDILNLLKPRKRIDLFFFYKECLTNIIRHSGATKVIISLVANSKCITLTITDNGHGIAESANGKGIPSSLKRRARLLRSKVTAEHPTEGGTRIILILRTGIL